MVFIMPDCLSKDKRYIFLFMLLSAMPAFAQYGAVIDDVQIEETDHVLFLNAKLDHRLSPLAKESVQKGITLGWSVDIRVKQKRWFWDKTIKNLSIKYQIKNHALLNLYSVKNMKTGVSTMFSTLTAALNSVSQIRSLELLSKEEISDDKTYYVAMQLMFDREGLPVPLRPTSYFDSQWDLSSEWVIWPLNK